MSEDSRFCPDCGSGNVEPDFRRTNVLGEMLFNQDQWICNECGYSGLMPTGEPDEETEFEEKEDIDDQVDINYSTDYSAGRGYLKYLVYVSIPLTAVYVLVRIVGFYLR